MSTLDAASATARRLAQALPDTAAWIDTRGMLLSGRAIVTGGDTVDAGFVVRVMSGPLGVVSVVGCPAGAIIRQAVDGAGDMTPVIVQRDNAHHVGRALASCPPSKAGQVWRPERAILHVPGSRTSQQPGDDGSIRLLRADDPLDHLPSGLRFEIAHARATAPVAAALVDARPVAFCYPCWTTETLWDVSVDTLEAYRRRGLAARVVRYLIARMRAGGREPVWGAMESNAPSLALARTLGFEAVDEIVIFSRGPWAYFARRDESGDRPAAARREPRACRSIDL